MSRGGIKSLNKKELAEKIFSFAGKVGVRTNSKNSFTDTVASAFDKKALVEIAKTMKETAEKLTGKKQSWTK